MAGTLMLVGLTERNGSVMPLGREALPDRIADRLAHHQAVIAAAGKGPLLPMGHGTNVSDRLINGIDRAASVLRVAVRQADGCVEMVAVATVNPRHDEARPARPEVALDAIGDDLASLVRLHDAHLHVRPGATIRSRRAFVLMVRAARAQDLARAVRRLIPAPGVALTLTDPAPAYAYGARVLASLALGDRPPLAPLAWV